jgi:hypothetical protein
LGVLLLAGAALIFWTVYRLQQSVQSWPAAEVSDARTLQALKRPGQQRLAG